jgi:hypothetical protein
MARISLTNETAEAAIRRLKAANPDLDVDLAHSDPRLRMETAAPGAPLDEGGRGPESHLEEVLLSLILAEGLPIPTFGHVFHPDRLWRFDAAYIEEMIAVEVDGGIHGVGPACPVCGRRAQGGHNSAAGFTSDREKINTAQVMGWIVLSVTNKQIEAGQATDFIRRALNFRLDQKEGKK